MVAAPFDESVHAVMPVAREARLNNRTWVAVQQNPTILCQPLHSSEYFAPTEMRKLPNEVVQVAGTHSLQYVENCFFRRRVGGHDYIGFLIGLVRTSNDARCFIMIHSRVSAESLQESLVGDRIYAGSHAFNCSSLQ